ncbi:PAS domain S-box protein [Trichothermofontia sichuanensis B231]|uniref:PAS domain S-box protein n=1 Tax=Trichothermofontia sichuanensis TaxID=3045816 RepID=UPI002245E19F|nr:PAS domain S-box protein [Trichothermofontia sichuanensis]UZQ56074.1 PAS domain S-box protein [Trichothermofontia sichuanensis B231]
MLTAATTLSLPDLSAAIIRDPLVVTPETPLLDAIGQMSGLGTNTPYSCGVVVDRGQVVGILTEGDVIRLSAQQCPLADLTVRQVMTQAPITLRESACPDLLAVVQLCQTQTIHHVPILDEQDQLVGVITQESLGGLAQALEVLQLRTVSEVMLTDRVWASPRTSLLTIAQRLAEHSISAIVIAAPTATAGRAEPSAVSKAGTDVSRWLPNASPPDQKLDLLFPVGIVTARDLMQCQAQALDLTAYTAEQVMSTSLLTVQPEASLGAVQQLLIQHQSQQAVVIGPQGEWMGLVTQSCLLQTLTPLALYQLTTALGAKVTTLAAEKLTLVENRTAELECLVAERTAALAAQAKRQQLLAEIATQIGTSLDLSEILTASVQALRSLLESERVLIAQVGADGNCWVVAEAPLPVGQVLPYRPRLMSVEATQGLGAAEVRLPIMVGQHLWGLIRVVLRTSVTQAPSSLSTEETIALLRAVTTQLAIVIQQSTTYHQTLAELTARKQIEARLRASERHYATLAALAPVGIFRTNAQGECIYVNDCYCQMTGLTLETIREQGWLQAIHPDDRDRLSRNWAACLQGTGDMQLEFRYQWPDGKVVWVYGQVVAERDEQGQVTGYVGTLTDISDRKRAELALQQQEAQSRALLAAIPDLIVRVGKDGIYRQVITPNRPFDIWPDEKSYVGLAMTDVLPPAIAQTNLRAIHRALATNEVQTHEQILQVGDRQQIEEVRISKCGEDEALLIIRDITARKQIEAELLASKRTNQAIVAALPDLLIHMDQHGRCLQILGQGGMQVKQLHPAEEKIELADVLPAHLVKQRLFYIQLALKTKSLQVYEQILEVANKQRYEEVRIVPLTDDQVVVIIRDITDLKKVEQQLRELNQSLEAKVLARTQELQYLNSLQQAIFDSASYVIITTNTTSIIQTFNAAAQRLLGYTAEEVVGKATPEIIHDRQEMIDRAAQLSRELGEPITPGVEVLIAKARRGIVWESEWTYIRKDGSRFPVLLSVAPLYDVDQYIIGFLVIAQDITKRKQAEAALRESEARWQFALEGAGDGVWDWNLQTNKVFYSPPWKLMLGYSITDIGDTVTEWESRVHPDDRQRCYADLSRHFRGEAPIYQNEHRMRCKDGTYKWILARGKVVAWDADGKPLRMIGTHTDISTLKQTEMQLQQANEELLRATRLKDEFLANMSHELRTPLNAILGMTEGLQDEVFGAINKQQKTALETIEKSGVHLLSLINDILDVAKIESGQIKLEKTRVSVVSLCQSSLVFVKQQALKKNIQLYLDIPSDLPELQVDERRIRQVLINLLNNAVKFTPEQGKVVLEVSSRSQRLATGEPSLAIAVRDTGIGIAPENLSKLFQPFIQIDSALNRQYSGTGLGLALVKRLVELHGGEVTVSSELGVGSCFTITLPCTTVAAPVTSAVPSACQEAGQLPWPVADGATTETRHRELPLILLAEDNEANIKTISSYLQAKAYRLIVAKTGQAAIAMAQTEQPDLILMDVQMSAMDGLSAMQQIRQDANLAQTPIIALTAQAMPSDRDRCLAVGANAYMSKPIKLKELANLIQTLLNQASHRENERLF